MNHAVIYTKSPLAEEEVASIQKKLKAQSTEVILDGSLTGGIFIEYNWRIYDYTLAPRYSHEVINYGRVVSFTDGIIKIAGLPDVGTFEVIENSAGSRAVVMSLGEHVAAIALDVAEFIPGERVFATTQILSIPVSSEILGRVVNPLGDALDGKGTIAADDQYPLERTAPSIMDRESVHEPLETGILAVDALIPIGRGQRELIIGDRKVGKTTLALTTILNQKDKDVICIYVAIAQKQSHVAQTVATLAEHDALSYTIVVTSSAADDAMLSYLAPFAGCAIAEYFLHQGKHVLVVYDDLTKHAWAYRELSLLLGRPSGREAYPGDIFYTHARLLERACKLSKKKKGGSITALPIIETQAGDVSTYVPTNVISITDGQLFLDAEFFNAGRRPAVSVGNSVSRVGSSAQLKSMKQVSGKLRLELSQFRELESFTQFGAEVDEGTKQKIERGRVLTQLLRQNTFERISAAQAIALLWTATNGHFDTIDPQYILTAKAAFLEELAHEQQLLGSLTEKGGITPDITEKLTKFASSFIAEYEQTDTQETN